MCFPSLTRNISLCAPTHCAPWPLAMRRRDDGKRRSRVCARPAVFVFALGTRSPTSGWTSLAAAQRAVTLLEASKDLEIINQVLKVKATLSPSFPSLATADRTGRLPGKCDALQAPFPRQVENFGCQATREFTAARRTGLWRRSSDTECARSEVASAALHTSTTASVKYTPQIEVNPQPLRFDVPTILAG